MTWIALVVTTLGTLFLLLAAIGLLRFPDVYVRSHAAGKAATLGVCGVLIGAALGMGTTGAWGRALLAAAFLLVTVPVATQLLARAALQRGVRPMPRTRIGAGVGVTAPPAGDAGGEDRAADPR